MDNGYFHVSSLLDKAESLLWPGYLRYPVTCSKFEAKAEQVPSCTLHVAVRSQFGP
jgi:hypothetical protein